MSNRIAGGAIRSALEEDDFWFVILNECLYALKRVHEIVIRRGGFHRQIQFCSRGHSGTGFISKTSTGIKKSSIFVNVCDENFGIRLKRIEDAIAMVRVDVDISDAVEARKCVSTVRSPLQRH